MCERDGVYLGLRRGDAAALLTAAVALVVAPGSAGAAGTRSRTQPTPPPLPTRSLFQRLGRTGGDQPRRARDPACRDGTRRSAAATSRPCMGDEVQLLDRNTLAPVAQIDAPGADAIAVSDCLARLSGPARRWRRVYIRYIGNPAAPARPLLAPSAGRSPAQPTRR